MGLISNGPFFLREIIRVVLSMHYHVDVYLDTHYYNGLNAVGRLCKLSIFTNEIDL
jgi:hypothetical protein